ADRAGLIHHGGRPLGRGDRDPGPSSRAGAPPSSPTPPWQAPRPRATGPPTTTTVAGAAAAARGDPAVVALLRGHAGEEVVLEPVGTRGRRDPRAGQLVVLVGVQLGEDLHRYPEPVAVGCDLRAVGEERLAADVEVVAHVDARGGAVGA